MIQNNVITVNEGIMMIQASLVGTKLAERAHDIFLQRQYQNAFKFFVRGLEESQDLSMHMIAKPYRTLMGELN